jgi:hypothetical protein
MKDKEIIISKIKPEITECRIIQIEEQKVKKEKKGKGKNCYTNQ